MLSYPVVLEPDDNGTVLVSFPDLPEAHTFGDDEDEAMPRALDALETAIMGRMSDRRDIPPPSPAASRATVSLPTQAALKVLLYRTMRAQGVRKAELARSLGQRQAAVDRLLDLRHASRLDQLDAALASLGKRIDVRLYDAA